MTERLLLRCALFTALITVSALCSAHDHAGSTLLGKPGDPARVKRSVRVEMNDRMRFVPDRIAVRKGETIRFIVTNAGRQPHEFVLGDAKMLREHAKQMKKFPDMKHDDPHQLPVAPGKTADLVWYFPKAGTVDFACLVPGHYEAGMRGRIAVK